LNFFSLLIGFGASFGLACAAVQAAPARRASALLDAGLIALAGALLGARAGYVWVNWPHFQAFPVQIPQLWLGGYTASGALAGGLLGLLVAAVSLRLHPAALADSLLPVLPPLLVCAWLANWQAGSAYGAAAPGAWWAFPTRDETGMISARFPLQPLAAVLTLVLFTLIDLARPRLAARGQAASLALFGISALLCGTSLLRADPAPLWHAYRLDTLASAALAILALFFLLIASLKWRRISRMPRMDE
jgi:prolipoprotein diacylglyceryltransferase